MDDQPDRVVVVVGGGVLIIVVFLVGRHDLKRAGSMNLLLQHTLFRWIFNFVYL